jgi:mono/diheme cytochrome c family protein
MRHRRCIVSTFTTLSVVLCLLGPGQVIASPEIADERTLGNGAQLYTMYCSECHGTAPVERQDEHSGSSDAVDYAKLIEIAQAKKLAEETAKFEEEAWPDWTIRQNPNEVKKPDERAEIMNLVTAVIEQAHEIKPESGELENPGGNSGNNSDNNKERGFEPLPGVTDLSNPQTFFYGTSEDEVFKSIANGTGAAMPGWRTELGSDEAIWDLVNYIRSFWGEEWL